MMNHKHIMVDLETLGTTPGSAILSIGAVEFFPDTQKLGREFYAVVDLQSCINAGLKVEGETFYWWLAQQEQARKGLIDYRCSMDKALSLFNVFIDSGYLYEKSEDTLVWAHGPSFDLALLSTAYHSVHREKPWAFRNERDTRTILDLAGMKMPKISDAHHALVDAKSQAITTMTAIRKVHQ